jgi:Cytochrome C oxidase, cbb3-type, subunit III
MLKRRRITFWLSSLFLSGLILWSCDRQRNMRGYDFMPDMVYSRAFETYDGNPNFSDSSTMRVPVPGTVPRGIIPFRYTNDTISRIKAGKELLNPFLPTEDVVTRGKLIFTTFCIHCHGKGGAGDGFLFTSGLYPLQPKSLSGEAAGKLKDGEIFHTITLGIGSMGAHGSQIKPEDRWKLIQYIRKLQEEARKTNGRDSSKTR